MPKDKLSIEVEVKKIGEGLKIVQREMKDLSDTVKKEGSEIRAETARMGQGFKGISSGISQVRNLLIGLGAIVVAKKLAGDFLDTARSVERMQTRLKVLLGSAEEGKHLFDDLASYAAKVPFNLKEIMESATMLAGVMRGGRKEIMEWMPLIGDLAAAQGLDIQQTTEQIMRMLSAGAASADYFRDKGVLAFLGFQTGVSYSAEETRKKLWESWASSESRFRGSTAELAKTWDGMISMLSDAWFQFMKEVMEAGVFDQIKAGLTVILRKIDQLKKEGRLDVWAKEMGENTVKSLKGIALAAAGISDAFMVVHGAIIGIRILITKSLEFVAENIARFLDKVNIGGIFTKDIIELQKESQIFGALAAEEIKKWGKVWESSVIRTLKLFKEIEREIKNIKISEPAARPRGGRDRESNELSKEAIALNERLRDEVTKLTKTKLEQLEIWRQEQLAVKGVNEEYINIIYNIKREALEREANIEAAKKYTEEWLEAYKKTDDYWTYIASKNKEVTEQIKMDWEGLRSDLQWSLEAGFFDLFKGGIKDVEDFFRQFCNNLVESFARAVSKMITEWLVFKAVTQIGGAIGGLFSGGGGTELVMAQHGLMINEPILGIGQSGQRYLFGEAGPEAVVPARSIGVRDTKLLIQVENKSSASIKARAEEYQEYFDSQRQMREAVINIAIEDIKSDGPLRKTIKRFG